MITSQTREADRKARTTILEALKSSLRIGDKDTAKSLGEASAKIATRMKGNYSKEDAWLAKEREILGYNPK